METINCCSGIGWLSDRSALCGLDVNMNSPGTGVSAVPGEHRSERVGLQFEVDAVSVTAVARVKGRHVLVG